MSQFSIKDCRSAMQACERLVDDAERSHAERDHWRNQLGYWRSRLKDAERDAAAYDKAQAGLRAATGPREGAIPTDEPICPEPLKWGVDELHCPKCGHYWSTDEDKPPCTL